MTRVEIRYCTQCKWLLRAAWMGQELLSTFESEIDELALCPAGPGWFEISVNGATVWSREEEGGFPEIKELKARIRDHVAPGRNLGHIDR